ncbi:BlaI/MecI/CopY family transcriptional regulator [Flagellimonas algicola]|uniref:BlaI/MecI/CopY family transcriptional regulator n=1 Tax=Flagellimonas algicola TaxID=2583815 RepID=A0ABY2WNF4_9FLAO|nr:BlaI/MecI/CopY family transcriptional regulator [Allomuricauda algicola]TMU56521.1 BlaI/MecI/CopY family transcriptional regulator [Allomuricauda algicola]
MKAYTNKELEILIVLWELEAASVLQVHEALDSDKGYTTTLKLMQIMFDKGLLVRKKEGKKHIYKANIKRQVAQNNGMRNMIQNLFGGSTLGFAQSFLGNAKPTKKELDAIKAMIKQMEKDA